MVGRAVTWLQGGAMTKFALRLSWQAIIGGWLHCLAPSKARRLHLCVTRRPYQVLETCLRESLQAMTSAA